jgi:hypothetical protein
VFKVDFLRKMQFIVQKRREELSNGIFWGTRLSSAGVEGAGYERKEGKYGRDDGLEPEHRRLVAAPQARFFSRNIPRKKKCHQDEPGFVNRRR